jgi:hypothetical protein
MKGTRIKVVLSILFYITFIHCNIPLRAQAGQLFVGWALADVTPDRPVSIAGPGKKIISTSVLHPLTATVLAIETRGGNGETEQAIMVSCDLVGIPSQTQKKLQDIISKKLNDFDEGKLFMNATHTHRAPWTIGTDYSGEDSKIMGPSEYESLFLDRTAKAVVKAWKEREPAGVSWGLSSALLGHNRRTVFTDGTADMHGASRDEFSYYEGKDDHRVQLLFFWNNRQELTGMVINAACPAQAPSDRHKVSSNYWHGVRTGLKEKHGKDLYVLPQISSAGDITPFYFDHIYRAAEMEMADRKGVSMNQEMADRTIRAVEEVMPVARYGIMERPVFEHEVTTIEFTPMENPRRNRSGCHNPAEVHVIRLGDIALATNPFELFLDYGLLIKKRSEAILTFVVELSCGHCGYIPSPRALEAGGYSATGEKFGPESGYRLVDETVGLINEMW